MKNLFKLFGMTLLLSSMALFIGCKDKNEGVDIPTNLKTNQSEMNVTFSWSGNAESYELKVEGYDNIPVTGTSHTLEMAEGNYTWQVRGIKGNEYSEWASGNSFEVSSSLLYGMEIVRPSNNKAVFNWKGYADSYDIKIKITSNGANVDEKTIENITEKTYSFENPHYTGTSYKYNWEIRAKKDNIYSEWYKDSVDFYMYEPIPAGSSISVEFKNDEGTRSWTAQNIIGRLSPRKNSETGEMIDFFWIIGEEITDNFATIDLLFPVRSGKFEIYELENTYSLMYFEKTAITTGGAFLGDWQTPASDEENPVGTIDITSYDVNNSVVSGVFDAIMVHWISEEYREANVKVTFTNIKLEK